MRFFFERYYNSECQVTNRLIFILWFFVVFDGRVKPRVKPEFSHERLYFSGLLQIKNTFKR